MTTTASTGINGGPNVLPRGVSNTPANYKINNDYFYPRTVSPPQLSGQFGFNTGWSNNPYLSWGLVRGYIYPMDVNSTLIQAQFSRGEQINATALSDIQQQQLAEEGFTTEQLAEQRATQQHIPVGYDSSLTTSRVTYSPNDETHPGRLIRYNEGKQFQFNPFAVNLGLELVDVAPPESLQEGGNASMTLFAAGRSDLKMYFDRSLEVWFASNNMTQVEGVTIDSIFRDVGVQKDIWDVFRIILGGDEEYFDQLGRTFGNVEAIGGPPVQDGSATEMISRIFDLGVSGQQAYARPIAVFYNPNLVVMGFVTGMSVTYAEFSANYVPTKAVMDIQMNIMSSSSESGMNEINETDDGTNGTDGTDGEEDLPPDANAEEDDTAIDVPGYPV